MRGETGMDEYKIWFANLDISEKIKKELFYKYNSENDIFLDKQNIYLEKKDVDKKILNILNDIDTLNLEQMIKKGIGLISIRDEEYPECLKNIDEPPIYLFYRGDISLVTSKVNCGIVGSRRCTIYGSEVTKLIAKRLSTYGISIISGGALGIDSIAHKTAVENEGTTVAVFGCGIDVCYPANNKLLYENIIKNGCLISEFRPGTPPFGYNFPRRNRIISGLSKVLIIVEGTKKSGSMITAKFALDQGKEIFAIPGSILSPLSEGPNGLIKDGALVIDSLEELKAYFNFEIGKRSVPLRSSLKERILKLLMQGPKHIDEIIRIINIDTADIYRLLFEMQFDNEIISLVGNYYSKVN